ncbi:MAG: oxidoreductase, partial [Calditrichaeota bacterium]
MKQVILDYKTGKLEVSEVPVPKIKPGNILVKTVCSVISAGTESHKVHLARKTLIGKAWNRPDQVKKVIRTFHDRGSIETLSLVKERLATPQPLGYSCSGIVLAIAQDVNDFKIGDSVACAAPHAEIVCVPRNLCVKIPYNNLPTKNNRKQINFDEAAFVTIGAIAIQSVREANVQLGEKIAVIGLGLLGQLIVQLLKASGCEVIGSDLDERRLTLASELGADITVHPNLLEKFSQQFSHGNGVDAVIITADTKSNQPLELAGKISRQKGKVIVVGRVGMKVPREIFYLKELELKVSRSYGPGRYDKEYEEKGVDYPFAYVRWTENRNMEAFLSLLTSGRLKIDRLITHRFQIHEAQKAYDLILKRSEPFLAVLLDYDFESNTKNVNGGTKLIWHEGSVRIARSNSNQIILGLIGCGNFARGVLIPKIKKLPGVKIKAVSTQSGLNARNISQKLHCDYCTTDFREILEDPDIQAVVVATRHDTHASITVQALKAEKHVFVEKPLAINIKELDLIKKTWQEVSRNSGVCLMVGFNRRFSPHAKKLYDHFYQRLAPFIMQYRINAGPLPEGHWLLDPQQGGGRIIGEICHFIDFFQFLTGLEPKVVCAQQPNDINEANRDNYLITLKFNDGSIGVISYISSGDPAMPKELVEVFSGGRSAAIYDFKKTELYANGRKKTFKTRSQDKGHKDEIAIFFNNIRDGGELPVNFDSYYHTTITSFK